MTDIKPLLDRTLDIFADEEAWGQGAYHRKRGVDTMSLDYATQEPDQHCLVGGLEHAWWVANATGAEEWKYKGSLRSAEVKESFAVLQRVIGRLFPTRLEALTGEAGMYGSDVDILTDPAWGQDVVIHFNDHEDTTLDDVRLVLTEAREENA